MISRALLLAGTAGLSFISGTANAAEPAVEVAPAASAAADQQPAAAAPNTPIGAGPATSVGTGANDEEAIIVTARRRQETAQDVPLAISVIGGEHADNTGAFNVGRLQQLTPSLQYTSSNPRNTTLSIRGIGTPFGLTNDGFEQGVGIYVDDVYYSRAASSTFDFLDMQQVEVLRGPQGTLYGKNTTAGAVNITSRQPTFDFEGRAELTIGNLGFKQAKGALSGPLSDTLAARFAFSSTSRRGTIFNARTGNYINEQDNLGVRGQLLFRPNKNLDITLSGDFSHQNPECCSIVFVRTTPTQRAANRQYDALAAAQGYTVVSRNPFDRLTDVDAPLNAGNDIGGAALRVKWKAGSGTLTSVTAWRFWDWKPENDRDFTGLPITTKSQNPSQQNQYTQEFRYNYSGDRLDFVVGLFGYKQKVRTQGTEQLGSAASRWLLNPGTPPAGSGPGACGTSAANQLACTPSVLAGVTANNTIFLNNTSAALFGQVAYKVTDALTIQPGIRVNYDKKYGGYARRTFNGQGVELFTTTPAGVLITAANNPTVFAQIDQLTPQVFTSRNSDWNFSYDVNLSYKVTRRILAYATYAKTFKSFGINLNGVPNDAVTGLPRLDVAGILPESVNHYEVGIKSTFWDRKIVLNLAAFRTDIKNYQVLVNSGAVSTTRGYLANADKARTQGFEADLSIRPSERFNVYVNGAYTDATYVKFLGAPCAPGLSGGTVVTGTQTPSAAGAAGGLSPASCDLSGAPLAGVSKWNASYGAEYNVPVSLLGKEGQVYLGFDGNARTKFSSNPSPSAATDIKGYALSNFRLGFRTESGIDVFGWVRNAFNTHYFELLQVAPGSSGLIVGNPGDARTWGGTVKVRF